MFTEDTLAPGDRRRDVEIDADETMTTAELTFFSGLSVGLPPVGEGAQVDRLPSGGDVAVIGDTSTFGAVEKGGRICSGRLHRERRDVTDRV